MGFRPVDYFAQRVGRLSEASFSEIWNGAAMRQVREDALAEFPEAQRASCRY